MSKLITVAMSIAKSAHKGDKDRAGKDYYEDHVKTVASNVRGEIATAVALLHDVVEDTNVTLDDIYDELAVVDEDKAKVVVDAVDAISKRDGERYNAYLARVKQNDLARRVKIADITHNMDLGRLSNVSDADIERVKKYRKALDYLKG